ncbi:MAG TPA: type VI secretion system tip protein TssI/VgrG [Polyangiaceae bacterium]
MQGFGTSRFTLHGDSLPDDVLVTEYLAVEEISRPYRVVVHFCTADAHYPVRDCLRQRLLLEVVNERGEQRFYDGIVDQAGFTRAVGNKLHFSVRLRPGVAALAHREDCRIYQDKSVPDVVKVLLEEAALGERVEWKLSGSYAAREYIVQYRESAWDFISRLLEDEGIFYFFSHSEQGHTLVFGDTSDVFDEQPDPVPFMLSQGVLGLGEPLQRFRRKRSLRATNVYLRDFDFKTPLVMPEARLPAQDNWPMPLYEHPGGFSKQDEGTRRATARVRELRRDADVCSGHSSAIGLCCAGRFSVEGGSETDVQGEFIVTRLVSRGKQDQGDQRGNFAHVNDFSGIPAGAPFAPERRTPKPRIAGLQTAVVTGPESDDQSIHVDEFGRIKVRFHWDRLGQYDENSSCWMRVNQVPMGGSMVLPRVGWEVSVAFLEGDPDRPLVLGRVYNSENMPPLSLPANKASSSLKSMSSPGGAGSNEITMGDSGGAQGFGIKAQKDLNMATGFDCSEDVKVDDEQHVNENVSRTVTVDDTAAISGNQSFDVGANLFYTIDGSQAASVGGNDTSNAKANFVEKVDGDYSYHVSGNRITISNSEQRNVTGSITRKVGAVQITISADSMSDNILGASTAKASAVRVHLVKGVHSETVAGARSHTSSAAELHLVSGNFSAQSQGMVSHLIGGVHLQKVTGDYIVKAPMISLVGGVGTFKGGSSQLKLAGGPITLKGSKITVKGALIKKTGASLKLG